MKKALLCLLVLLLLLPGCRPANEPDTPSGVSSELPPSTFKFTTENYPKMGGSLACLPLGEAVTATVLGIDRETANGMISFAGGNPSPSALPDDVVSRIAQQVLADNGKTILQYGATEGYAPFVQSLKAYVNEQLGCEVPAVLPVTGSTQAMDLLCKALIDPGDAILVENPSFLGNLQCMKLYQAKLVPVESDEGGLKLDKLEEAMQQHHPKLLYVIPTFQNPTGKTLAADRRKPIAELAAKYGVVVAEDDPYRDLRYSGTPAPSIKSFDKEGWVMFLGSFSKIVSPGIRVGYMAGDERIIRKCTLGKQSTDVHTANLNQAIVDQFLRQNLLPDHIKRICADYKKQLDAMLEELDKFPAGTKATRPEGGLFIWVELPEGTAGQGRGAPRGLRARHLLLCLRRPREHPASELLQQHRRADPYRHEGAQRDHYRSPEQQIKEIETHGRAYS